MLSKAVATIHQDQRAEPRWLRVIEDHAGFMLPLVTLAMLLPFASKPFHIDDPMFIWAGEHILRGNVIDFYGFTATWTGFELPMHQLMQNPPLAAYYIALIGALFGVNEIALHLAFMIPATLLVMGVWRLARDHCRWPALAALITAITPVFVISSTMIMSDIIMVCCWVWALHWWDRGLRGGQRPALLAACGIAGIAFLAKYPAMNLLLLMAAYALVQRARLTYLLPLLIPVLVILAYELGTSHLYGAGLLSEALQYAQQVRSLRSADPLHKMFITICFAGACLAPALLLSAFLWSMRSLVIGAGLFLLTCLVLAAALPSKLTNLVVQDQINWVMLLQIGLWFTAGLGVIALCVSDLLRQRNGFSLLLNLWVLGTLCFAGWVNWSVNARSILPMTPAVALLMVRRLEARNAQDREEFAQALPGMLIVSAALALLVARADHVLAQAGRRAAQDVVARFGSDPARLWFQGHWGFQYYMQRAGARPFVPGQSLIQRGDVIAVPVFGTNVRVFPEPLMTTIELIEIPVMGWLSTMHPAVGAGFYSDAAGPLPFVFEAIPPEQYLIQRVNVPQARASARHGGVPQLRSGRRGD